MSYSATISFKKIKLEDVYDFLHKIKERILDKDEKVLHAIAKDNYIWSPMYNRTTFEERLLLKKDYQELTTEQK